MVAPVEIIGPGQPTATLIWEGHTYAHRQSEATGECLHDLATTTEDLCIEAMKLISNYGLNIHRSDHHGTGIYRFGELWHVRNERQMVTRQYEGASS